MLLFNVQFGRIKHGDKVEAEDVVGMYLSFLGRSGQAAGEYEIFWKKGTLNANINLAARDAHALRHHSAWGKASLRKIRKIFGREPKWILLEDPPSKGKVTWGGAPFLFLYTNALAENPPIRRGDDGVSIPAYRILRDKHERQAVWGWERDYQDHDMVWLSSGPLEIPAYKELVEPRSELSETGREICRTIEKATGIPTYYYLMRYWGRRKGEEERRCPGCGGKWRITKPKPENPEFWHFDFKCKKCRFVSHLASSDDDPRHAAIGEFKLKPR